MTKGRDYIIFTQYTLSDGEVVHDVIPCNKVKHFYTCHIFHPSDSHFLSRAVHEVSRDCGGVHGNHKAFRLTAEDKVWADRTGEQEAIVGRFRPFSNVVSDRPP